MIEEKQKLWVKNYPQVKIELSPKIPPLKKITDKTKINVRYSLIPPFAFAHIYWDAKISELAYEVEEPILNEKEKEFKEEIISAIEREVCINTGNDNFIGISRMNQHTFGIPALIRRQILI